MTVNAAQHSVTILYRVDNNSNCHQVKDLVEPPTLLHHFFVQAPQVLTPRRQFCFDLYFFQPHTYLT